MTKQPPKRCPHGHLLTGLQVVTAWQACSCPGARQAGGHTVYQCTACAAGAGGYDCAWYDPPHTPAPEEGTLVPAVLGPWRRTDWTSATRVSLLELARCAPTRPLAPAAIQMPAGGPGRTGSYLGLPVHTGPV